MSDIEVRGGVGGLSVGLTDLEGSAARLHRVAAEVAEVAARLTLTGIDPALTAAGLLAPLEYLDVERALVPCLGSRGAAGASADLMATAVATTAAVRTYRAGEHAVDALADGIATGVGEWVGRSAAPFVVGVGVAAVPAAPLVRSVPAARDAAHAVSLGLGHGLDEMLFDHPWLVPAAADGLDGLILGLGQGLPVLGLWLAWRSGRVGVPYPPGTHQEALGVVLAATRGAALDESGRGLRVRARPTRPGTAPAGVADLVAADGPTSGRSRVRVTGIPREDGGWAWVVDVPGTQSFDPRAGANPYDLTSNVLLVAGESTLTMQAVVRALEDARLRVGDAGRSPVMLTGHSQGGLTAAALAADPRLRARLGVTHVVTSGAPIAAFDVPDEVSVLSLEHTQDPVPGLEGANNPDRVNWVTVERSVADDVGPHARSTGAHDNAHYTRTAGIIDASDDPSLAAWRAGAAPFIGASGSDAVTTDYDIERG